MRTALTGIDYIIDLMGENGKIARSARHAADRHVIDRFNAANAYAQQHDWITVLVRVGFEHGYRDLPEHSPIFGKAGKIGALDLSGPGTDFVPELSVNPQDIVITKPRINAFYATRLAAILAASKIERVVIAGVSTSMAVQSTAREAHDRDFHVVVAEDACAAATPGEHQTSIDTLRALATITTTERLSELS